MSIKKLPFAVSMTAFGILAYQLYRHFRTVKPPSPDISTVLDISTPITNPSDQAQLAAQSQAVSASVEAALAAAKANLLAQAQAAGDLAFRQADWDHVVSGLSNFIRDSYIAAHPRPTV